MDDHVGRLMDELEHSGVEPAETPVVFTEAGAGFDPETVSPEELEQLRSLGYLQ